MPSSPNHLFKFSGTFMNVRHSPDPKGARAAVLGIPYDMGTAEDGIGARQGPSSIRERSRVAAGRPYKSGVAEFSAVERLGLVDCGDVRLTPSRIEEAHRQIEAAVELILDAGAVPVTMGGDGSVTLPQLRALRRKYRDLAVLHVDAHTDTYPDEGFTTGSTFTRAAEEGILDVGASLHVGPRGSTDAPYIFEYCRQVGYQLVTGAEIWEMGLPAVIAHIRQRLAGRPVYLCWDMDVFDPAFAPGVCDPVWGGLSAREGLQLIDGLSGLDFVAFDVNTVTPSQDIGGQTAFLAATVMNEFLHLACQALGLADPRARA